MATAPKVLAQSLPSANTLTDAYTVPNWTVADVSSIMICNQSNFEGTFRVAVSVAGEADGRKQYLYYDVPLDANDTFEASIGIELSAGDIVRVYASMQMSFNVFGIETKTSQRVSS
jgi:hypothetical protein